MSNDLGYVLQLIWYLVIFFLIIGAAFYVTRFIGQSTIKYTRSPNLQVIDYISLGKEKGLYIVRVGSKYILIGASSNNISYLAELDKEEVKITKDDRDFASNVRISIEKLKQLKNRYLYKKDGEQK